MLPARWRRQPSLRAGHKARRRGARAYQLETLEPRNLLTADPIQLGMTYLEPNDGADTTGNTFQLTWSGGAAGTQLTQLVISTDKEGNGLGLGDTFFDVAAGAPGVFGSMPFTLGQHTGIDSVQGIVSADGKTLTLNFVGFDAGEKLFFKIDVDELGFLGANAVAEGNEFEGSKLDATFVAQHYYNSTSDTIFYDAYDPLLTASGLNLPPDDYVPPSNVPQPVFTAGAFLNITQTPLPITISGTVYDDTNTNNVREGGESGIASVSLTLERWNGASYVSTGLSTTTDAGGNYLFSNPSITPGQYRVVETQPSGYLSIGATAGTVAGVTRGVVESTNVITTINLDGGDDSIHNDFAEAKPVSLGGHVYHDRNNNGVRDTGEEGIGGATVQLQFRPVSGPTPGVISIITAADGSWVANDLTPGTWDVVELQPSGYVDGLDRAGTVGGASRGTVRNPGDSITTILLTSGQAGINYDFGELVASTIAGQVRADRDGDCEVDPGEPLLAGVTVELLNSQGSPIASAVTDAEGRYSFANLVPGTYQVRMTTPGGYFTQGSDAGTAGGVEISPTLITAIPITSGTTGLNYDFCLQEPASLSGYVWSDLNQNGFRDVNEQGIANVTIRLLDANGNFNGVTTTTNASGLYQFTGLRSGTYGVQELQPNGYFQGSTHAGTASGAVNGDTITGALLLPNMAANDYNFGELLPGSLSGYVLADRDGDCQIDPGEQLLAGVTIWLLDAGGLRLANTLTDAQGNYKFDNLAPGTYGIEEVLPPSYFAVASHPGSEAGTSASRTLITSIVLAPDVDATEYYFCVNEPVGISGYVFADDNMNRNFDGGELPLAGVAIQLLDGDGNQVAETLTNASGYYELVNLQPGTYSIREIQPNDYFDGGAEAGDQGGDDTVPNHILDVTLTPSEFGHNYNFGELRPASISGYVFQDGAAITAYPGTIIDVASLRDGQRTSDDTPLAGVVLRLADLSGEAVLDGFGNPVTAVTDANGFYRFTNLMPGEYYTVYEVQPSGYVNGIDSVGTTGGLPLKAGDPLRTAILGTSSSDDAIARIFVTPGQESIDNNFSEVVTTPPVITPPPPIVGQIAIGFFPLNTLAPAFSPPQQFVGGPAAPGVFFNPPPTIAQFRYFGGVGEQESYTWHLSVVNDGTPRGDHQAGPDGLVRKVKFNASNWSGQALDGGQWTIPTGKPGQSRTIVFGTLKGKPVAGDFNGDGLDDVGVFIDGDWFIDLDGNGVWDDGDLWLKLGAKHDLPVVGDWDGDGKSDVGIFGPSWEGDPRAIAAEPGLPDPENTQPSAPKNVPPQPNQSTDGNRTLKRTRDGRMREDLIDHVFRFGVAGDVPLAGDWNGEGIQTIGLFSGGTWYLDTNGDGRFLDGDKTFSYGLSDDLPVVGDFDGDGQTEVGVYRRGTWYIDRDHSGKLEPHDRAFDLGGVDDQPVVGDWDGDGRDEPGLYRDRGDELTARPTDAPH
ncbi:MAG: carboxypeptidase regulatory-like domain-containing protein [Pirellulales bacterium]|nr:carboxypeptidase regulatory-like domain-containing protein [Pirellulales bacterium]